MRALTLTQPWAGLVASGIKLVENRPRAIIKREDFGKPFAIHASREIDEIVYDRIYEIAPELNGTYAVEHHFGLPPWSKLSRITSAVIGVATIDHVAFGGEAPAASVMDLENSLRINALAPDQRRWFFGPVGYVLRDVRALPEPVPCRGWQGFWTLDNVTAAIVSAQIGGPP